MSSHHHQRQSSRESSPARNEEAVGSENVVESAGVVDGYRLSPNIENTPSGSRRPSRQPSFINTNTTPATQESKIRPPMIQTTVPPLISRNSFSLRHDAQYSDAPRRVPSVSSSSAGEGRPMSMLSRTSTLVRPQSVYAGPSAPSHPYGMYPQNASEMVHRASVNSGHRPTRERSFNGADQPTHPYGMYPQDTSGGAEADPLLASTDIASVGFPGLRHDYARRLGPDGEDADDLIGPDGHQEQLPPYTKYAVAGSALPKAAVVAPAQLSPIPQESPSQSANSGDSMTDSLLSPVEDSPTRALILPHSETPARKRDRWNEKSKQRTCWGKLPLWIVYLFVFFLVAVGAVLGGVVGKWLATRKATPPTGNTPAVPEPAATLTRGYGGPFTITTTLSGPKTAPTGVYHLAMGATSQTSDTCMEPEQRPAWECLEGGTLKFTVQNPPTTAATIQLEPGPSNKLYYGDQLPFIEGKVTALLKGDSEDADAGAALYFNTTYDKHVILRQSVFDQTKSKRSLQTRDIISPRSSSVVDLENVWSCWWNETTIDGYIYINTPSQQAKNAAASAGPSPPSPPSPPHLRRDDDDHDHDEDDNDHVYHISDHDHDHDEDHDEHDGYYISNHNHTPDKYYGDTTDKDDVYRLAAPVLTDLYPQRVKIREYRMRGATRPYCQLMQYCNGTLIPPPSGGKNDKIDLNEADSSIHYNAVRPHWRRDIPRLRTRDTDGLTFCHCDWIIA